MKDGAGGETGDEPSNVDEDVEATFGPVERQFTCTACGFATTYEVPRLQGEVQSVCANCGDWTSQYADDGTLLDAAEEVATSLAGRTLTERQALAYLLRDVMGVDRRTTAELMESTPSNVDNLQRKATEKLEDAERVLDGLGTLEATK